MDWSTAAAALPYRAAGPAGCWMRLRLLTCGESKNVDPQSNGLIRCGGVRRGKEAKKSQTIKSIECGKRINHNSAEKHFGTAFRLIRASFRMHTDDIFIRTSVFADECGSCNQQDTEWKDNRIKGGLESCDGEGGHRGVALSAGLGA